MKKIKIDVDSALLRIINKIENRKSLMASISLYMLADVKNNFELQGRPRWIALASSTIKERKRLGYWDGVSGPILKRTGQLLKSIQADSDYNTAQVGTNKSYAAIHQFGGIIHKSNLATYLHKKKKRKKKISPYSGKLKMNSIKVPARPFLVLTDSALKQIEDEIRNYLSK